MNHEHLDRLTADSISLDLRLRANLVPRGLEVALCAKNETYLSHVVEQASTGIIYTTELVIDELAVRKLCKELYVFLDEQESPHRLHLRLAGNMVSRIARNERVLGAQTRGYEQVKNRYGLPAIESLLSMQEPELMRLKSQIKLLCLDTPASNPTRITGTSFFSRLYTPDGNKLFPTVDPYITLEQESQELRDALKNYANHA